VSPVLAAAVLAAALAAPAGAATQRTTAIDLGGARGFVHADQGSPLAGVELIVRAGLDRQTAAQNGLAALVAETVLRTPSGGVPLAAAVEGHGAGLSYSLGSQSVRFYLDGTPEAVAAAAPLVAAALAAPAFDPATLAAARTELGDRIDDQESDPRLVGRAMLRTSYYRGGAGLPVLGDRASLARLGPADAKAYYAAWYRRGDAVVAAVGRTGDATDAASRALVAALPAGSTPAVTIATRPFGVSARRIITHRDVGAPYVVLGFAAPPLGDRDFAAALVIRSLLGSLFDRGGATTPPTIFRPIGTSYATDVAPAQLVLWINGARVEPDVGLSAIGAVVKAAAAKPLTASVLGRYKETARGEWTLETVTLDRRACAIGDAVTHGLDADAGDDVAAAISRVTAADVQRVAKKYFQRFDVALILPRTGN
jgi:predicted Zn-dependent peptidase